MPQWLLISIHFIVHCVFGHLSNMRMSYVNNLIFFFFQTEAKYCADGHS